MAAADTKPSTVNTDTMQHGPSCGGSKSPLFKTMQACYGTQRFTTVFKTVCHLSPSCPINPVRTPHLFL